MQSRPRRIEIDIARQQLALSEGDQTLCTFPISTSAFGIGTAEGSLQTPYGVFTIAEKIGDGAAEGAIFKSRELTGEFGREEHSDDHVQTRILWLHGLEPHNANTHERYIYIHGTNHEAGIGTPASHGCIRMRNADIAALYDLVEAGTEVCIQP